MLLSAFKSKTFWAGLGFAVVKYLETQGILPLGVANMAEAALVGFGLYGARNTKRK